MRVLRIHAEQGVGRVIELKSSCGTCTLVNFSKSSYRIKGSPYNVHRATGGELNFTVHYGGRKKKTAFTSFTAVREFVEDRFGTSGPDLDELLECIP